MDAVRNLVLVLGDQLNHDSSAFDGFDPGLDAVWMAEVAEESEHVWSSKQRIGLFLAAMRHFRDRLLERGIEVHYSGLDDPRTAGTLAGELQRTASETSPERLTVTQPGDWRVLDSLRAAARIAGLDIEVRPDRHFLSSVGDFGDWAAGRKQIRLEHFYRKIRRDLGVLMQGDRPAGGRWNFDAENRGRFGKRGPGMVPAPRTFGPDPVTAQVLGLVERRFAGHPGSLDAFDWPVTPEQARLALADFIDNRLPQFGEFQDAMWSGEPYLYHARISAALNLKLLDPRDAVTAAEVAYHDGRAPLPAVEGFVRQIIGWREYVRGIYWTHMPEYEERNALGADLPLPEFYWTGDVEMTCLREAIGQTLSLGYAHHIQRLMVTGLFALLLGVDPREVHRWYLAVYVDAVEWVELPNTVGMSQYADGGLMASKPYAATGKYIKRMSNYCSACPYDPAARTGQGACPFTTLYWDFLERHRETLTSNSRMRLQLANLERIPAEELAEIRELAAQLRAKYCG